MVRQWQGSLELLARRDQELEAAAGEVDRVRGIIARREVDLQEQLNFLSNEMGNNEELRREVTRKEKKAQQLREKLVVVEEEKRKYENEVTVERRQILQLSIDIDRNRSKLSKIKKDKMNNIKKLNGLKLASSELENRRAVCTGMVLGAEERVAGVETILEEYERQFDCTRQEVARLRERCISSSPLQPLFLPSSSPPPPPLLLLRPYSCSAPPPPPPPQEAAPGAPAG